MLPDPNPIYASGYGQNGYNQKDWHRLVRRTATMICDLYAQGKMDYIVCRGMSGVSMAFAARAMAKRKFPQTIINRKNNDSSHGEKVRATPNETGNIQYGRIPVGRYMIVDDLIASGSTVRSIAAEMPPGFICTGVVLYDDNSLGSMFHLHQVGRVPVYYSKQ